MLSWKTRVINFHLRYKYRTRHPYLRRVVCRRIGTGHRSQQQRSRDVKETGDKWASTKRFFTRSTNKQRWTTRNLAKRFHAYLSTLFETGAGSRLIFQRLFLSSLTNLSVRAGWNQRGQLTSHTFNRCQLIVPSKLASPHIFLVY